MAEQSGDLLAPPKPRKGIGSRNPMVKGGFSIVVDPREVGDYFLLLSLVLVVERF